MSNDVSGPFKKNSGPPYLYKVSFTIDSHSKKEPVHTDCDNFITILNTHASNLGIQLRSRKTVNGYDLAFLKSHDYETLLESIETDLKKVFEFRTQRINRYANSLPDHEILSADRS